MSLCDTKSIFPPPPSPCWAKATKNHSYMVKVAIHYTIIQGKNPYWPTSVVQHHSCESATMSNVGLRKPEVEKPCSQQSHNLQILICFPNFYFSMLLDVFSQCIRKKIPEMGRKEESLPTLRASPTLETHRSRAEHSTPSDGEGNQHKYKHLEFLKKWTEGVSSRHSSTWGDRRISLSCGAPNIFVAFNNHYPGND